MNLLTRFHPFGQSIVALATLCTVLTSGCGGEQPAAPLAPTTVLSLTPSNPQIAMGTAQQFSLRALAADGRTQELNTQAEWTLQDESGHSMPIAGDGFLQLMRPGLYTVSARLADRQLSTPISVTAATLSSVALSPRTPSVAKGSTLTFKATATFSDGTTQDVTALATWSVKDVTGTGVATIDTTGLMRAVAVGSARITAKYQTRSSYTTATITPAKLTGIAVAPANPTIAAGTNIRFAAAGTYSDGSTADVSSEVTWSVTDEMGTGVASIDGTGTANGLKQGRARISAEIDAISGQTLLTVGPGVPVRLDFSSPPAQTPKGTTARFVAMATLSDGGTQDVSSLVTWTAADVTGTSVASVNASGVVTGNNVGKARITASLRELSVSANFEVTAAVLRSIQLSPTTLSLVVTETRLVKAMGTFSDGSSQDVSATASWTSSDVTGTDVVSTAAGGKVTGKNLGKARVTATLSGFSASADVEVSSITITAVSITPFFNLLTSSAPLQVTALGTLSTGGTLDVTNLATWSISVNTGDPAVWKVVNGAVTGGGVGDAVVKATYLGYSSTAYFWRPF